MNSRTPILEVSGLAKTYRSFKKGEGLWGSLKSLVARDFVAIPAVKPMDFTVMRGEFVGLLGPNGAGKTTTLKMLTGLIPPTAGTIRAFQQYDTSRRPTAYLQRIGMVMGQRNQLHPDLPAIDSFRLSQAIYGISEADFQAKLNSCLDLFTIRDKLNIPVRKLSLGERMKMETIFSLLHNPELLFLDEPTIGLDFQAARHIRSFLQRANEEFGVTIMLTSHYLKDIEELCKRVIVISKGQKVFDGPLETGGRTLEEHFEELYNLGEEQAGV